MEEKKTKYKFQVSDTVRGIVAFLNESKIPKEKIVSLIYNTQYVLIYAE